MSSIRGKAAIQKSKYSLKRLRSAIRRRFAGLFLPRIVLIDDDPIFCEMMRTAAEKMRIKMTVIDDPAALSGVIAKGRVDVVILDYDLGPVTGIDVAAVLGPIPSLLTSRTCRHIPETDQWPDSVVGFVPKKLGVMAILETTLDIYFERRRQTQESLAAS